MRFPGWCAVWACMGSAVASADPGALRAPTAAGAYVAEWGAPSMSAGVWYTDRLGFGVDVRQPGASFGISAGTRTLHKQRVGLDGYLSGGLVFPLRDAGLGLTLTPAIRAGARGKHGEAGIGVAVPLALGLAGGGEGVRVRAPILLEPSFGMGFGGFRLGVTLSGGPVLLAGAPPGVELGARVALGVGKPPVVVERDEPGVKPPPLPESDEPDDEATDAVPEAPVQEPNEPSEDTTEPPADEAEEPEEDPDEGDDER